jgi:hypothetical protein
VPPRATRAIERLLHHFVGHPLAGLCYFVATVSANEFFNELGDAVHDSIGVDGPLED